MLSILLFFLSVDNLHGSWGCLRLGFRSVLLSLEPLYLLLENSDSLFHFPYPGLQLFHTAVNIVGVRENPELLLYDIQSFESVVVFIEPILHAVFRRSPSPRCWSNSIPCCC